jgi:hypothetical protein
MRKLILIASAAAMAAAMPALAKPGKAGGHGAAHAGAKGGKAQVHTAGAKAKATTPVRRHRVTAADRNGNGILDSRERRVAGSRYGANDCPPGLAKKNNGCLPPGQAKKIFTQGQRIPAGYNFFTDYSDIPVQYRDDIPEMYRSGDYRYIYRDDTVYVVDPTTRLVRGIFDLFD